MKTPDQFRHECILAAQMAADLQRKHARQHRRDVLASVPYVLGLIVLAVILGVCHVF